jgi:hypothetical protein
MYSYDQPRQFLGAPGLGPWARRAESVIERVTKWGVNASPFSIAKTYLKLHWKGITFWRDVSRAARAGRALIARVEGLEKGARVLKRAVDELSTLESGLPSYPLAPDDQAGQVMVSAAELSFVERYRAAAASISHDASAARVELDSAISGWDAALREANRTKDFTRQAVWEAITLLDLRFGKEGGSFRGFLATERDRARRVESDALLKVYHAAHIVGKWTPGWYVPPSA